MVAFGTAAEEASTQITTLDTGEFVGPEGDMFRDGLDAEMPKHLQITGTAFTTVSDALIAFASTLGSLQDQMRPLAQQAPALWQAVQSAQGRVNRANEGTSSTRGSRPGDLPGRGHRRDGAPGHLQL